MVIYALRTDRSSVSETREAEGRGKGEPLIGIDSSISSDHRAPFVPFVCHFEKRSSSFDLTFLPFRLNIKRSCRSSKEFW